MSTTLPNHAKAPPAARRRGPSLINVCLTPKADVPRPVLIAVGIAVWLVVLAGWSLLTYGNLIPSMFLPSPGAVLDAAQRLYEDGTLSEHVFASVRVVLIGFAISSLFAIPIGMLMRYLPVTSFVPLFILWIGIGLEQRVTVIIFGTFFQQLVMVADVSRGVSKELLNASYTLGSSRRDVLLNVLTPASVPGILDTLRVTMGWAWTYLVVAELVAASSGLGYLSMKAMRGFQVDVIFMAIGIIGLLGLITDQAFRILKLKVAPWAQ
jgi:NitT/TauT family transport system permease protein